MAVTGVVTARREAVLRLSVLGVDERKAEIEAVLDTGFTGYLTLPAATVEYLALPSRGVREAVLADGSTVVFEVHRARVVWDGEPRGVQVLSSVGSALIGMSLLYGHEARISVVEGGNVVIELLP